MRIIFDEEEQTATGYTEIECDIQNLSAHNDLDLSASPARMVLSLSIRAYDAIIKTRHGK